MRGGLKTIRTAQFTTCPGMSAVGASTWTNPWNGETHIYHSAAQPYSIMYNTEQQAYFFEVHPDQNAYFDGKAPYTRDRSEISRDSFSRPHSTDLWMAGHLWIGHHNALGGSGGQQPILFQWHDKGDAGDAGGMPPPVSIIYTGTVLRMQYAWSSQDPFAGSATAGSTNIGAVTPGVWQTVVMRVFATSGYQNGEVDVWLNGTQLITYRGNLSTPNVLGLYEKFGIYRFSDTINFSVCWAGLQVTSGTSLLSRINETKPNWTPSTYRSR
jgi:hypothetical protein